MNDEDRAHLLRSLASVFEGLAFMFVDEADDDLGTADAFIGAGIEFRGRGVSGEMEIIVPADLCKELAENILGTDDDDEPLPEDSAAGALAEVLNVACGYLLVQKHGDDHIFDLSIPHTRPVTAGEWDGLSKDDRYVLFAVDDAPLLARLSESPAESPA
ncbi:MAG: hypothetical protein U5S82_17975 [Gammaproteobacteria bacterium]|nr:hypothetical protein [Gammaproteobacteria bacterium]